MPPTLPSSLYPEYAPLPIAFAEHLLLRFERKTHALPADLWDILLDEVAEKRNIAYFYMNPFVRTTATSTLTTAWLLETLAMHTPEKKRVPRPTLSYWARKGLIHYDRLGHPTLDSAAALFIARMIDTGERNFLPERLDPDESTWWCFAQTTPEYPWFSHPISHLAELPPSTLVWTRWAGATWQPDWVPIHDRYGEVSGAIRWAGTITKGGQRRWNIPMERVIEWSRQIASFNIPDSEDVAHLLATLALHELAVTRIGSSGFKR